MRVFALCLLTCLSSLPTIACSAAEDEPDEVASEGELRALSSAEIIGTLAPGDNKSFEYSRHPLYRAFKMTLQAGQKVDIWVTSQNGDARAWLLGDRFQTLALSSDASEGDRNAHIEKTVARSGTYYLAVREEKKKDATFWVSMAGEATPPPPPASDRCTSDAQCGGGSAMCFIDRCVTVSDESKTVESLTQGIAAAYTPGGALWVAYKTWRSGGVHTFFNGAWGSNLTGTGSDDDSRFVLDHAPGREPVAATTWQHYNGDGVAFGTWGGPKVGYHENVRGFAVGRNDDETLFVAMTRHTPPPVNSYQGEKCALLFAQRPKNGSWSQPETVDTCNSSGYRNLAIHVRKDGTADIVAAGEFGNIDVYRRQNPIDPWSKTMLTSVTGQGRPSFVAAHGADGTTHLVTQPYYFTTSSSNGDYTGTYVELGDDGPVRSVPLTTHRQQYRAPFLDLDVDGAGNVWIQKRPHESRERPSVLRIDRSGNLVERSLGLVSTGPWLHSSLAVSKAGEIALVHVADNRNVSVRRFTPVAR